MSTSEETGKTPEWMLLLENKKKRPHRLAHEIGAGAPCLSCGDTCPGLDLHFWRKLCRNCKCKKEEHDVRDDEGYEQFEILFANSGIGKKKRTGAFLNIKVPESSASVPSPFGGSALRGSNFTGNKSIAFDWVPPDVPEDVAAEYMQQLPHSKLPISGSDGALFRRQQLEKQVPLHDLDASKCHGLTPDEIQGHQQYLENLKNNVVGQGRVTKIPGLYVEQRVPYLEPAQCRSLTLAHSSVTGDSKPIRIATSQSAQCLRSLPLLPVPRPFASQNYTKNSSDSFPPPPPESHSSSAVYLGLKTPSAFFPLPPNTGHTDAQLVTDQQGHDLVFSADNSKQSIQYSTEFPGKSIAQTLGVVSTPLSTEDENQYTNFPFPNQISIGQPNQTMTHARDGTFVSEQQAHEIAYSTQIPVGLVSQHSKAVDIPREGSNEVVGNKYITPSGSSDLEVDIPRENKQAAGHEVRASRHPAGVSFSTQIEAESVQTTEPMAGRFHRSGPSAPHGYISTVENHNSGANFVEGYSDKLKFPCLQQGGINGTSFLKDRDLSVGHSSYDVAYSSAAPGRKPSSHSFPLNSDVRIVSEDSSVSECPNSVLGFPQIENSGVIPQDAKFIPYLTSTSGQVVHSVPIAGDSMPKSALVMQQSHLAQEQPESATVEHELAGKLEKLTGLVDESSELEDYHLDCHKCKKPLLAGEVGVLAERAGEQAAWHPQCFVCCTCEELLVDLIYFYHKGEVYCGRHYAELLNIPRCFACDELIFVKEYTCAEGKAFHVKHFCCYECDTPLGGKQYIPKDNQPVCLECFQNKYGKTEDWSKAIGSRKSVEHFAPCKYYASSGVPVGIKSIGVGSLIFRGMYKFSKDKNFYL
ncbi:uncharacterized protein LOC111870096 isoform X2 [Cryptotermes secundus]|uniref:uncharacterized protein LOC111870096 isoform X2 n=1 Tax=Cryptotermes secundus TaxID=105785 RepID=UPI000CD7C96C|nr:uncharacterized protein LOC111870096 isoform X2 [Cryptotermes secundus]